MTDNVESKAGTYVAITYDNMCTKRLIDLCVMMDLPNIVRQEKIHTTLIYSTNYADNVLVNSECSYVAIIDELDIFTSDSGIKCLVARLNCPHMNARHKELMNTYNFNHGFPEYIPHITLSYDIEDWDKFDYFNEYIKNTKLMYMMIGTSEYTTDLDLNWKDKLDEEYIKLYL
jgi:hypothetical protein